MQLVNSGVPEKKKQKKKTASYLLNKLLELKNAKMFEDNSLKYFNRTIQQWNWSVIIGYTDRSFFKQSKFIGQFPALRKSLEGFVMVSFQDFAAFADSTYCFIDWYSK